MSSGRRRLVKALFVIVTVMGFISLMLAGVFESEEESEGRGGGSLRHMKVVVSIGEEDKPQSNVNSYYMTKRRVPNGSDPIHNRKAGNSGRPPRQA